jgi:hypothetical protein
MPVWRVDAHTARIGTHEIFAILAIVAATGAGMLLGYAAALSEHRAGQTRGTTITSSDHGSPIGPVVPLITAVTPPSR